MATNLALSDKLIAEAVKIGRHRTKKEAVTTALEEYIKMKKRLRVFDLLGKIDYHDDYDHKALRRQKNRR
jgi:hypothetical protein